MQYKRVSSGKERAKNVKVISIAVTVLALLAIGISAGFSKQTQVAVKDQEPTAAPSATYDPVAEQEARMKIMTAQARHFKGDANAPVTILEFSDFQ